MRAPLLALVLAACGAPQSSNDVPTADGAVPVRWDHHLIALMPQIDACLAQSPATRWIRYAGGAPSVLVRLEGPDGRVDCRVENGRAAVTARDDSIVAPGEGDAIFVRGPGENPGGECYTAPEVRGADGALLGWMLDPLGC